MPADAKEIFDEQLPQALARNPQAARDIGAIYCFKIGGDGGGTWTVDLVSDPPAVAAGDSGKAQCTIEVQNEDFKAMLANPALGMQLYFQGKLKIGGNMGLAMKVQKLMALA
jgi:putative sterol carrier protein